MSFIITPKVMALVGVGTSLETGKKLKEYGCRKIMLIYDEGIKKAGIVDPIINAIEAEGIDIVHFSKVQADPSDTLINEAGALAVSEKIDGIVGLGGGSSMDTAKGVNTLIHNPPPISTYYHGMMDASQIAEVKPGVTLILIPTTAGTGSEVSKTIVVTDTKRNVKTGTPLSNNLATLAIVDAALTKNSPPSLTAVSGMDAFSHAIETITSAKRNIVSEALAAKAVELVWNNIHKAFQDPTDMPSRENLSLAACITAMAFIDAPIHIGHYIIHAIGAKFHTVHGICCAYTMPALIEFLADKMPQEIKVIAKAIGLEQNSPSVGKDISDAIKKSNRALNLKTARECGYEKEEFLDLAKELAETPWPTPVPMSEDSYRQILDNIYEG